MRRLLVIVAATLLVFAASVLVPVRGGAHLYPSTLDSDGGATARLTWRRENVYGSPVPYYPWPAAVAVEAGRGLVELLNPGFSSGGPGLLELGIRPRSGGRGRVVLLVDDGWSRERLYLEIEQRPESDGDADGIPNALELHDAADRQAFRAWFTALAAAQFDEPAADWQAPNRDCAGLVRYAFVHALRRHDSAWRRKHPRLARMALADVGKYNYPQLPLVGPRPFRTRPGSYQRGDAAVAFSAAAGARVLWEFNTVRVAGDLSQAQAGDLLVFSDSERQPMPRHLMILLDSGRKGDAARVVYHTGPGNGSAGEVRLVTIGALAGHADDSWHPRPYNPHFQGIYRFKILDSAVAKTTAGVPL